MRRVVDEHLQHEPVDLSLRQRIGALRLDRILRREHEKRVGHRMGRVPDRHLPLLHHLEQRRLHLRGRTVDLVGEQEVAEDRPELGLELVLVGPEDPRPDEIARDQIGRELDPRERAAEHRGRRLDRQRLREPRHTLDQQMAARQQTDEQTAPACSPAPRSPAESRTTPLRASPGARGPAVGRAALRVSH